MSKIICVMSGKGGTGKTTVTANLAVSLARFHKETLVIDADLGLRNMDLALGLQDLVVYDVLDVSLGNCMSREAIIDFERISTLHLLPASQFKENNTITEAQMRNVVDKVREKYDYILIDCPAGLGEIVKSAASVSDMALIVVNPDPFSVRDADRVADLASKCGVSESKLIINRFRHGMIQSKHMMNLSQIIEEVAVEIIGAIPEDEEILLSVINSDPIAYHANKHQSIYYRDIARRLSGQPIPILEVETKKQPFWKRRKKRNMAL